MLCPSTSSQEIAGIARPHASRFELVQPEPFALAAADREALSRLSHVATSP
jgi:hypothetical protein